MFFLSKGIFRIIYNKNVIKKALVNNETEISINQPLPLVEVIRIIDYEHHFVLSLFDGEIEKEFIIEKDVVERMKSINVRYTQRKFPDSDKLSEGSILQFDCYNYCHSNDLKKNYQIYFNQSDEFIIKLTSLFFIGLNKKTDSDAFLKRNEILKFKENINNTVYRLKETMRDKNGKDQFGTYNIVSINYKLNYVDFKIKAYLKKISLISQNKCAAKKKNYSYRLLFQDLSGYIEFIAQSEYFNSSLLNDLELNKIYSISLATIKKYNIKNSAWPNEHFDMRFELHANEKTRIEMCPVDSSNDSNLLSIKNKYVSYNGEFFNFSNLIDFTLGNSKILDTLCLLDDLQYKNSKDFVSIIGIIHSKDESFFIRTEGGTYLSMMYFQVVDRSKISMTCTLMGLIAEMFPFNIGDILIIENCQLTDNGGISICIRDSSKIYKISENMQDHILIKEIKEWWSNEWWNSRNQYEITDEFKRKEDQNHNIQNKKIKLN